MLKKRLVGVITVRQGWAVQSFGFRRYLPIGRPEILAENLDRWGVDEILIQCIDRTKQGLGPNLKVLQDVARVGISTPLVYGGGIATADQAIEVVQQGADRIVVDRLLHENPPEVVAIARRLGAQAVVASMPAMNSEHGVKLWNYCSHTVQECSAETKDLLEKGVVSEVLMIDVLNEGRPQAFDASLLSMPFLAGTLLIPFGGISAAGQMRDMLSLRNVSAVAIGNFLSYREHAVQAYKNALNAMWVRPAHYGAHSASGQ